MKKYNILIKIGLLFLINSYSKADCDPGNLSILSISPSVIDFRSANQVITTFQAIHQPFTGTENCYFFNDLDYGAASSFNNREISNISGTSNTINFNTYSGFPVNNSRIVRVAEDASQQNHVIYQNTPFTPSLTSQIQSRTFISELDIIPVNSPPGIYTESLVFKLRARSTFPLSNDFTSFPVVSTRAIQFIYEIPKTLDISVVSTGQSFDANSTSKLLSFNNMATGNSLSASIVIQTNVGYRLFVSSTNDGVLKHLTTSATVPYTFSLSGSTFNLGGSSTVPVEVSSEANSSPAAGYDLPLSVTIGTVVGNEIGGRYSDVIAMTIQAF